ncbi:MAG: chromosome segregation protein SMC [Rhodothermaceae bacterium]|nr:chromosome segregation protein SMC [Rhodothermaceae bacterium]MBC12994.1 chromosome segregation protein SMC [Rhodothermaceae bacterium]
MPGLPVQTFRLRNFKAVRDSGTVKFSPFTVFIGNNGVGKSSLIEGLETFRSVVTDGLDEALRPWLGLEHALHKGTSHKSPIHPRKGREVMKHPLQFTINGWLGSRKAHAHMEVGYRKGSADDAWIESEYFHQRMERKHWRDGDTVSEKTLQQATGIGDGQSILTQLREVSAHLDAWQFALLDPNEMGLPRATRRTRGRVRLARDGSNVAEYLLDIRTHREGGVEAFEGIVETLAYVLPYAEDLQPAITREIERSAYLQLSEQGYADRNDKLPGWLLSTGTLRVLALLALLRDPDPPPLIVIEELENGLDPRTIHLIVSEIRDYVARGNRQVIATTHSPYLLDLLDLDDLILAERVASKKVGPHVTFSRPGDEARLVEWAQDFSPGRLYTMGRLSQRNR